MLDNIEEGINNLKISTNTALDFNDQNSSYETTLKANRRISNIEPQNFEVWYRFAQSFDYKIDRIHYSMLDVQC